MSNSIHPYVKSAHQAYPENFLSDPYGQLEVGAGFDGSSPSSWATGVITKIHDAPTNRIFHIKTDLSEVRVYMKHETRGEGWLVKDLTACHRA